MAERPTKTDEELRALWAIFEDGHSYEEFPDGATWADLEDAKRLVTGEQDA